ncbi:uncharacterized protein RAG0_03115 [Rhynchosporium agropyri]|uniref:C2H2-type domain-containing protein n=1 Tax=Rhynchosporium agropyri TaxID=914238 RepID=A0A1E1K310_9HELO|nr:uncharacterized protein RAG0_03115 [Rhynchosporium agropyri]
MTRPVVPQISHQLVPRWTVNEMMLYSSRVRRTLCYGGNKISHPDLSSAANPQESRSQAKRKQKVPNSDTSDFSAASDSDCITDSESNSSYSSKGITKSRFLHSVLITQKLTSLPYTSTIYIFFKTVSRPAALVGKIPLLYEDIKFQVFPPLTKGRRPAIRLILNLQHIKRSGRKKKPNKFDFRDNESIICCLVIFIIALAITDNAFKNKFTFLRQIYDLVIPNGTDRIRLKWDDDGAIDNKLHTKATLYCPFCERGPFQRKDSLGRHVRVQHLQRHLANGGFLCPYKECSAVMGNSAHFLSHARREHMLSKSLRIMRSIEKTKSSMSNGVSKVDLTSFGNYHGLQKKIFTKDWRNQFWKAILS